MATRRSSRDLLAVPRALGRSHLLTQKDLFRVARASATGPLDRAGKFLKVQVWGWVWHYIKTRLGGRYPFATYGAGSDNGVYDLGPEVDAAVKVSITGDWGTGTEEAFAIGQLIERGRPDFTIHLGDVYYVGTRREIEENMLGEQVSWPRGARRSFALNGNHEMYARGKAYFRRLLPALGQGASYFALRNDHWVIVGLDTGYNSVGIPILEKVFKPSCRLPDEVVRWLRDDVELDRDDSRGIVLLSHHQYYSAFEGGHERPARQLGELLRRPVLWFWGHEHRFAIYGKARGKDAALETYGRCVGHGAMPIEKPETAPDPERRVELRLALYDGRTKRVLPETGTRIGYNGYADLLFRGPALTVEHWDIDGTLLVRERWQVDTGGILRCSAIEPQLSDPAFIRVDDPVAAMA